MPIKTPHEHLPLLCSRPYQKVAKFLNVKNKAHVNAFLYSDSFPLPSRLCNSYMLLHQLDVGCPLEKEKCKRICIICKGTIRIKTKVMKKIITWFIFKAFFILNSKSFFENDFNEVVFISILHA